MWFTEMLKNFINDGKVQAAVAAIIVQLLVGLVPDLTQYADQLNIITGIIVAAILSHAVQEGLSKQK